ncbi:MAG: S1 family peptidase, partial [Acidimicrobiia bacterium]|nr:S1 family peptidase [Acidimicrobiia bacterium]
PQLVPLTRAELRSGLDELVMDRSIVAANSSELAAARLLWDSDQAFVAQLDYQLDFRSRVDYLSTSPDHLANVLSARPDNFGIEELGLYLFDDEVAEMQRRFELGDRMEEIVRVVTGVDEATVDEVTLPDYGSNFGGIMQDQMNGGVIVLALRDPSLVDIPRLEKLAGGASFLKVVKQDFSYNEIEDFRTVLESELDKLGVERNVTAVWSERGRSLEVRVEAPLLLPLSLAASVPEGAFAVVRGEPVRDLGDPDTLHSYADQQPGLRVQVAITDGPDGICTWGHNGHTASYHYIVMAGHCFQDYKNTSGTWVGEVINLWQDGSSSRDITPGNSFLKSIKNADYDTARIESSYANDNCYHGDPDRYDAHCKYKMSSRALGNTNWEVGSDVTCASLGNSGVYRCGYITEENHGTDKTVGVGMNVIGGDSGSGMKYSNRIDGILNGSVPGTAFFQTAYRVKSSLGFDFNCHNGLLTTSNPSDWATCPGVNP